MTSGTRGVDRQTAPDFLDPAPVVPGNASVRVRTRSGLGRAAVPQVQATVRSTWNAWPAGVQRGPHRMPDSGRADRRGPMAGR